MSPERARVLIAENEEEVINIIERTLIPEGHQVLIRTTSFESAMDAIEEAKEKGINVAVLDGSLPDDSSHGPKIAEDLRLVIPEIKIVSFSGEEVFWGDLNLHKPEDVSRVGECVRNLT